MIAAASCPETGSLQAQNPAYRLARHFLNVFGGFLTA
jgi:hypothetical protein